MELIIKIVLLIGMFLIFYQDLKYRVVSIWIYGLTGLCAVLYGIILVNSLELVNHYLINFLILILYLLSIIGYIFIKTKKINSSIFKYIGSGDLVYFGILIFLFSPIYFLLFVTASLLFSLILHFILKSFSKSYLETVPLAGFMSMFYILVTLVFSIYSINPFSSSLIYQYYSI